MIKRFLYVGAGFLLLLVAFAYHLSSSVVADRNDFMEKAEQWARQRTSLKEITEIQEFRGKESYAVLMGKNVAGTPIIIWINEESVQMELLNEVYPREKIIQSVQSRYPGAVMQHAVAGLDGDQRFWEIVFMDEQSRYHYQYYDLYTGQILRSYRLQKPVFS